MRPRGTGHVYEKYGAWYGRWRSQAGARLNRRIGPVRSAHGSDGLTRGEAERRFREMQAAEDGNPTPAVAGRHAKHRRDLPGDEKPVVWTSLRTLSPRLGTEIQLLVHATQSTEEQLTTPPSDSEVWTPLGPRGPSAPAPERRKPVGVQSVWGT